MTYFLLHGGKIRNESQGNELYYQTIVDLTPNYGKISCIYFGRDEKDRNRHFEHDKNKLFQKVGDKDFEILLMNEEKDYFSKQVSTSDTIIIAGGCTEILHRKLQNLHFFQTYRKEVIIAGSSAGAYIFSESYFENDTGFPANGEGILPFSLFCHFDTSKGNQLQQLQSFNSYSNILCLKDAEFIQYVVS